MVRPFLHFLSLCLLAGCVGPVETAPSAWQGTLVPVAPGAVTGTAAAVSQAGRTLVSVEIRGGAPGSYGWRMVGGLCAAPGDIRGGIALYTALMVGPEGTAHADAAIPGELSPGGRYAVQVLGADGVAQPVVACADLTESS